MFRSDSTIFRSLRAQICNIQHVSKYAMGIPFAFFGIIILKHRDKIYRKMVVLKCLRLLSPVSTVFVKNHWVMHYHLSIYFILIF